MDYERGGLQKAYYREEEVVSRVCPLCGGKGYSNIYKERGNIGIVRCKSCNLIYTNPMVKESQRNYWGDERRYYQEARLIFEGLAKSHRDRNYLEDLNRIEKEKPQGNLLDIGTNAGFFLRNAAARKWNVYGIEPSPSLSEMARKHFGLNVKTTYLDEAGFEDEFFDCITMTDVFEHVREPRRLLSQIRKVLKKDGILFIKVPNGNYNLLKLWLAEKTGRLKGYDIFDSYEHITHFTQGTLKRMLAECGFEVEKVFIASPIQLPVWHKYVGHFYQYPSPWTLDAKNHILRMLFYWISRFEFLFRAGRIGFFASNITVIASKKV